MTGILYALPNISAVIGTALMLGLLLFFLARYFVQACAPDSAFSMRLCRKRRIRKANLTDSHARVFGYILLAFLISRALLFAGTAIFACATNRSQGYFSNLYGYWVKWDAPHYLGLIRNWYVNEGDAMYHIVFFPVYPLICKLLTPIFAGSAEASAFAVSNVCALGAGCVLYTLIREERGARAAKRAVRYLFLNPLSFFLSLPYTESLFLLLTLLAVYFARKRRFLWAICIGALCSASRLMGALVAIPIFYEMLCDLRERQDLRAKTALLRVLACCGVLAGVAAYLFLNWRVTGNPFQFWIYQRDHWYNTRGTMRNTFSYIVSYAIDADANMRLGTWIPTIIAIYGAIALLCGKARRSRPDDAAYSWAYLYMTIVPTWLISGPRYVSGMYSLYPLLADAGNKRWKDALITVAFALSGVYMACAFTFFGGVY